MKQIKFILTLILLLAFGINAAAEELTAEQRRFRSSLQEFLKEEGFMPTIDPDDESLTFKKEGIVYWITFEGSSPLYIEFHRGGIKIEDADKGQLLQAVNTANSKVRCAKAMTNNNIVSFAIEMYCHSAEEFKYIFYKSLKELERIKEQVAELYNGSGSSGSTASRSTGGNSTSGYINKFFPIYGFTLGKTTIAQAQSMGYELEVSDSGHKNCDVKDLTFWDFNDDNVFDYVTVRENDALPSTLRNLGFNWNMSYNQMLAKFKELGFNVKVTKTPQTSEFSGRKTLSAEFKAIAPTGEIAVIVKFDYGNDHGQGYSTSSPGTFYQMTFDIDY